MVKNPEMPLVMITSNHPMTTNHQGKPLDAGSFLPSSGRLGVGELLRNQANLIIASGATGKKSNLHTTNSPM